MNAFVDPAGSMRPPRDASARFAMLLDRAVIVARAGRLCEFAGRVVVAVALAILAIAVGGRLGLRVPFPGGPIVVAVAVGIAAWLGSRRWRWPDRLATAMTLERAHPRLGERISRAVAFIGGPSEEMRTPRNATTVGLMGEAVEEAATAFEALFEDRSAAGHPVRGPLFPLRWPVAGIAAAAAVALAAVALPGRFVPPVIEAFSSPLSTAQIAGPARAEPLTVVPKDAAAAAVRLAEAAATEERLAAAVLARFAASPGGMREELPRGERDWLDEIASLQSAIADDIGRDLATVVAAVQRADPRLAVELAGRGLVSERAVKLASAAERVRGNQLAVASGLIASEVRPILAALRACGVVPTGHAGPALDRAGLVQRRILAAIQPDGDRPPAAVDPAAAIPRGEETDLVPGEAGGGKASQAAATVPPDRAGLAAGGTAGDSGGPVAGGGAAPAGVAAVVDAAGRLPAWARAREQRSAETLVGDAFSATSRYRAAVDDYYRRLWAAEAATQRAREATP